MTAGKMDSELIEVRPDERLDTGPLEAWLRDNLDGAEGPFEYAQFGGGHANLTYLLRFGDNEFVLRRPPLGPVAASAHDMSREHRVLSVLWREFDLAPRCFSLCTDHDVIGADFMVMERRNGFVIRKDLPENLQGDPVLARRIGEMIIDCLARFHAADPAAVGLEAMGRPEGFAERQLEGWTGRWQAAKDQDIPAMDRLTAWLADNLPEPQAATFVHNDYKLDNMLVAHDDPARAVAVLDWDMCTRGDPLMDLGYLLTYWPEAGDPLTWRDSCPSPLWREGFPTRAEAVQRYAELSGLDVSQSAWYHAWGTFKIAVVIQQIYIRWLRGQTQDERFAVMGERVRILIDKGCKIAGVSVGD
jgi:aminoglycoside phosphotransferase (APT) family kinase protein